MTVSMEILIILVWLDLADSPEENWRIITQSTVCTFPVCRGSLNEVVGVAGKERLWEQYGRDRFTFFLLPCCGFLQEAQDSKSL